jgi:DNA-binding Lrp family transcriptional regulator
LLDLKELELRLVSELMKNSRRSDRELAKVLQTSQPTVSRAIRRLEKEGVIKEYTIVPDFSKLGFGLISFVFNKLGPISAEGLEELHKDARALDEKERRPYLLLMEGQGLGKDLVTVQLHRTYADYVDYVRGIKELAQSGMKAYSNLEDVESFLIDLNYKKHYQPLTLSRVAKHLQREGNEMLVAKYSRRRPLSKHVQSRTKTTGAR